MKISNFIIKMKTQNKPQFTFLVSTILQKKEASWFQYSSMQWCRSFFWANSKSQLSESKLKMLCCPHLVEQSNF